MAPRFPLELQKVDGASMFRLMNFRVTALLGVFTSLLCGGVHAAPAPKAAAGNTRFEVSFPASLNKEPITGRVFVTLYTKNDVEPRVASYQSARVRVGRV